LGSVALNVKPSRWKNDVPQSTETLPDRIVSTAYSFRQSKVLFVAAELDVFGILAVGPLDLETLKARSGVHPRGARDFFDALVALGLLDRDSKGRYANTPESDCYLVRGKPTYIGGLLRHLDKRHYENWDRLCRALITGESQSTLGTKDYSEFYADERTQQIFLEGMSASSLIAARSLGRNFHGRAIEPSSTSGRHKAACRSRLRAPTRICAAVVLTCRRSDLRSRATWRPSNYPIV